MKELNENKIKEILKSSEISPNKVWEEETFKKLKLVSEGNATNNVTLNNSGRNKLRNILFLNLFNMNFIRTNARYFVALVITIVIITTGGIIYINSSQNKFKSEDTFLSPEKKK